MSYLLLVVGLAVLIIGANWLVKGATSVASRFGLSNLVVGLTVVAFGTSSPELAVSISSAFNQQSAMAIANVVGSNIFNVLFILGIAAVITPLFVSIQLIRRDLPIMVLASGLLIGLLQDGTLTQLEAALLLVCLVSYLFYLFKQSSEVAAIGEDAGDVESIQSLPFALGYCLFGIGALVLGAEMLVHNAINIAQQFGVDEGIIGLTVIAMGTSLPELVTSIVASLKGQRDIAIGNVVGSNTFNLLAVLGVSGIISANGLIASEQLVSVDVWFMCGAAILCLPLFYTGAVLSRLEGFAFLLLYAGYMVYLAGTAFYAPWLPSFIDLALWQLLPLALMILIVALIKDYRSKSQ